MYIYHAVYKKITFLVVSKLNISLIVRWFFLSAQHMRNARKPAGLIGVHAQARISRNKVVSTGHSRNKEGVHYPQHYKLLWMLAVHTPCEGEPIHFSGDLLGDAVIYSTVEEPTAHKPLVVAMYMYIN